HHHGVPHRLERAGVLVDEPVGLLEVGGTAQGSPLPEDSWRAPATAASTAAALAAHSSSSAAGSLSATMPAPACTEALPSAVATRVRIAIAVSKLPEKSMYPTTPAYGPR